MSYTIMTVYGTRPEAIKVAPVIKAIESSQNLDSVTVVTGQHRTMLDQVNDLFGIVPDHDLDVFAPQQTLNSLISKVINRIDSVLVDVAPDALLVQGDTSTVAAASIAAFYRKIPIVHLEAGLRSGNIRSPFPEEANRKITTQVTKLHLAPTPASRDNLIRENIDPTTIAVTGNTVIDALLHTVNKKVPFSDQRLTDIEDSGDRILLVTTHRRENWGGAMEGVGRALRRIAERYPDTQIILPAHKNPVVRKAVLPHLVDLPNVLVTEPLPYGEFTRIMARSHVVLTDSGGVQEEAPSLGKPVLVMRDNTERPEAVSAGTVRLIGTDEQRIVDSVSALFDEPEHYASMANAVNPYGDGRAAARSLAALGSMLGIGQRMEEFRG